MLTNKEVDKIKEFVRLELGENSDLFDLTAHLDNSLTISEAINEIAEKIKDFKIDINKQVESLKNNEKIKSESKEFYNSWADGNKVQKKDIIDLFNSPKIIGIISDANAGKTNLIYNLIKKLQKIAKFKLFTYGLKKEIGDFKIYSIEELEKINNSVIFLDEFYNIFDLNDRKKVKLIEKTIRLIYHNNNILVLIGVCENFRKFLSNKLDVIFFGKCTLGDFVNGSRVKEICLNYGGIELGSSVLNLPKDKFIIFDGHYRKMDVSYLKEFDTKKENDSILKMWENLSEKNLVQKNVEKKLLCSENENLKTEKLSKSMENEETNENPEENPEESKDPSEESE